MQLLKNGDFETGQLAPWKANYLATNVNPYVVTDPTQAKNGQCFLRIEMTGDGGSVAQDVQPNGDYANASFSLWLRRAPGATGPEAVDIAAWGLDGTSPNDQSSTMSHVTLTDEWTFATVELGTPNPFGLLRVEIYAGAGFVDVDAASFDTTYNTDGSTEYETAGWQAVYQAQNVHFGQIATGANDAKDGAAFLRVDMGNPAGGPGAGGSVATDAQGEFWRASPYSARAWLRWAPGSTSPATVAAVLWETDRNEERAETDIALSEDWQLVEVTLTLASYHSSLRAEFYAGGGVFDIDGCAIWDPTGVSPVI